MRCLGVKSQSIPFHHASLEIATRAMQRFALSAFKFSEVTKRMFWSLLRENLEPILDKVFAKLVLPDFADDAPESAMHEI